MSAIRAGVAVLVIGPTIGGGCHAIGMRGVVERWVLDRTPTGPGASAGGDGWLVQLDRPIHWSGGFASIFSATGIFPATSLMPLDGQAEAESTFTAADLPQPVEV